MRFKALFLFLALIPGALPSSAQPARDYALRLSTENDFFVESRHKDDLYTFSVAIDVERGPYTWASRSTPSPIAKRGCGSTRPTSWSRAG